MARDRRIQKEQHARPERVMKALRAEIERLKQRVEVLEHAHRPLDAVARGSR